MPSRKQRRRQQKLKRHEWEEVYVDEEGNELPPEEVEELVATARASKPARAAATRGTSRSGRTIDPPSWRRTLRRGLIFFPLMLLGRDLTLPRQIGQTVVLMGFFLPFSYFMDTMVWRSYQRRLARSDEKRE